ncbi:thiol reductant ABC exporter subunit CydC, partial [Arthrobacter sp. SDTb3-6]|uniref:thiol reductant ABC exporter subunit CydC n=1 Tax=Arthrobacter sp. SDTb3-6 TaxID=2713571 RepID=UPI00159D3C06|nr:thiol reductant ABC exporter subunit CydC [Arthrobacter sp. SDTb3-6]
MARPSLPPGRHTRTALAGLAGLAALKAVALVLLMSALAHALAVWAGGTQPPFGRLALQGSGGAVLMAAAAWGQQVLARRAALGAKEELRARLVAHRLGGGPAGGAANNSAAGAGTGAEGMLASRGLDGLDGYFTAYLPALVSCAVLPAAVGLQILVTDRVSALVVVLTLPLVPVFMVLIGFHTQDRVERAARGLDRLSNHLLELARGLPVLVGLRRAGAQRRALADVSEEYRKSTMATLRTAFLSSMALELISTISVAIVAVFIGVRLVAGDMGLEAGLLALMLAPECFRPLRDVGAAHHGSEDGVEALRRVNKILNAGQGAGGGSGSGLRGAARDDDGDFVVRADALAVAYPGRTEPALSGFTADLAHGGVLVLDGPSGTGKTTALAVLAGPLPGAEVRGRLLRPAADAVVWVPQHPLFTEDTVAADVALYAGGPHGVPVPAAAVAAALARANAGHLAGRSPLECSPGELRRVAVARALARIAGDPAVELALFDEPTAHLDPVSAQAVRQAVASLRGTVALAVATHDPLLAGLLRGGGAARTCAARTCAARIGGAVPSAAPVVAVAAPAGAPEPAPAGFRRQWLRQLPWRSPRFVAGVLVSALATLSAAALSGISGWLIVWAAARPPIMYLMVLIVGVRAFGVGRSVLRYSERLLTHDAVLRWAAGLRLKLWDALGSNVRHWGRLTRSGGALGTLIADVDELRDAVPRAVVPIPAAVVSYLSVLAAVWWLVPQAAATVAVLGVLALLVLPVGVHTVQRRAAAAAAVHRSWLASRATTLLAAAGGLHANGVGGPAARAFAARDLTVSAPLRRLAWAGGLGQAGVALLTSLAAVAVAAAAIGGGADPRAAAVAALLMLALAEPLGQYLEAVEQLPVLGAMMARTLPLLEAGRATVVAGPAAGRDDTAQPVTSLRLDDVTARYPEAALPVFSGVGGGTEKGRWWTVSGPSGSGKSTLLAVLLGFLTPERGSYTLNGEPAAAGTLRQVAWCPQEAYLFNSTLRSNLALARPAGAPTDGELEQALETAGLGPWYRGLPDGLDTRVGPGGHHLSGGQRTRVSVARTLVAGAGVVLLDEPTAHLGGDEAGELVAGLRTALTGAAVVMVTHDGELAAGGDTHLALGEGGAPVVLEGASA